MNTFTFGYTKNRILQGREPHKHCEEPCQAQPESISDAHLEFHRRSSSKRMRPSAANAASSNACVAVVSASCAGPILLSRISRRTRQRAWMSTANNTYKSTSSSQPCVTVAKMLGRARRCACPQYWNLRASQEVCTPYAWLVARPYKASEEKGNESRCKMQDYCGGSCSTIRVRSGLREVHLEQRVEETPGVCVANQNLPSPFL